MSVPRPSRMRRSSSMIATLIGPPVSGGFADALIPKLSAYLKRPVILPLNSASVLTARSRGRRRSLTFAALIQPLMLNRQHHRPLRIRIDGCGRSEEHTSELQSLRHLVCRLLLQKKKYRLHHDPTPSPRHTHPSLGSFSPIT